MAIFISVVVCFLYTISCLCVGAFLLSLWNAKSMGIILSPISQIGTAFLLGQCGLAVIWTGLGLLAFFSAPVLIGVLALSILIGGRSAWKMVKPLASALQVEWKALGQETVLWKIVAILTVLLIGADGLAALVLPPIGDADAFYMSLSKVMADSHRLVPLPGYEAFTQIGLFGELHYGALLALGGLESAKLFAWVTALAAALLLVAIGSDFDVKRRGQWLIVAMLFTSTAFTFVTRDGKVDVFGAALGVAAFFWALQVSGPLGKMAIGLAGLFVGFSIVAKISYMLGVFPVVLLLVLWQIHIANNNNPLRDKVLAFIKAGFLLGVGTFLPLILNIVKNTVLFDQPLAPFIVTNGQSWVEQTWFSPENTRWILMTYPLALVFGEYPMQYGGLSVLVLAYVPTMLFLPRHLSFSHRLYTLGMIAAFGVITWVIVRPSVFAPRYLLATLLLFIPLIARSTEWVLETERQKSLISSGILVCLIFVSVFLLYQDLRKPKVRAFIANYGITCLNADCGIWNTINKDAPPGSRVFLAGYYRFWLRPDLIQCISNTNEMELFSSLKTEEESWTFLYEHGFRYLILNSASHETIINSLNVNHTPAWLSVTMLEQNNNYSLFRIELLDGSVRPLNSCQQVNFPAWDVVSP